jgi:MFS family permease
MMSIALLLAVLTIGGFMSPWLLLVLTFLLSAGDAFETPTWRAILPELVPKDDLAAASALNGIEFNLSRAVGPALAGIVITVAGVAAAFVVNVVSFFGVILLVVRWKKPIRKRTTPPETLTGATVAAIRYVRHSVRPPLARDPDCIARNRRNHVLFQCALCVAADGGSKRE